MQTLIDRLKAATGPDYGIDLDIARALGVTVMLQDADEQQAHEQTYWRYTEKPGDALSLIPDGMFWLAGCGKTRPDEPLGGCQIFRPEDDLNPIGEGEAPTVALAICIAALEARAAISATSA